MSDRMINLFIKEVKKAHDGLMPNDLRISVHCGTGVFEGTLRKCDDAAGVLVLEKKAQRQRQSGLIEETDVFYIRYTSVHAVRVTT